MAKPARVGRGQPSARLSRRRPSLKLILFTLVVALLGAFVGVAVSREAAPAAPAVAANRPALPTPRPALARNEQTYIEALWPIHTEIERIAVRVALGASFYKLNDLSRDELKTRLLDALAAYQAANQRLRAITPPQTLQPRHDTYVTAVRLFQESTLEMLRMFDDGSDEHLARGFPMSIEGSDKIREVGAQFWPDEYPPN
jgi:hypothetical protein